MIVREAAKEYLEKIKMERLRKSLIKQCKDTAKLNIEICNDFKYVDGEQEWRKGIMRLPHFLRKFAMTEGENKRRNTKDGFPPAREWHRDSENDKKVTGMT